MVVSIIMIALALAWLMYETDYMRVRLPVGIIPEPIQPDLELAIRALYKTWLENTFPTKLERIGWDVCVLRYPKLKLSCGVKEPLCGWKWLKNNTHPIPQVNVDFTSGGVRYHWNIKDCNILKDAIAATHARPKNGNGQLHYKRNKLGGLVAPLPAKAH